jgi:acetyl esterase
VFQVLEIPLLDLTLSQPSIVEFAEGLGLTRAALQQAAADYLDDPTDASDAFASPLLASDLSGLPPALIMTAEFDPLRDQGAQFATRLRAAGVDAELCQWEGHVHGAASFTALLPSARSYRDRIVTALRDALTG